MIASTLRLLVEPHRKPEVANWQTHYLRNQFPFLGVKTPLLRQTIQQLKYLHPTIDWKRESKLLLQQPEREFHLAAILWAIAHRKQATAEDLLLYEEFVLTHSWWDTVDTIAPHLIGPLIHRFPALLPKTQEWLDSPHLWLRRTALIYPLHKRKEMDTSRLFHACKYLSTDPDFFIRKAIGWVLREHSKTQPTAVAHFLATTKLSPLSHREASKKLTK